MTAQENASNLQIDEDLALQERTWIVERIAWGVLGALVIAALAGLFGGGWLANARAATEDGRLSVEFDRFWRIESPTDLRLMVTPAEAEERMRVWLAREYVEAVRISGVTPRPERVEAGADRLVFEFALTAPGERTTVIFRIEPDRAWRVHGRAGIDGGDEVSFGQFIYP